MFRATGRACEVNRRWRHDRAAFEPLAGDSLAELRRLAQSCRIDVPKALPPALACLVGYFGYETIGLVENLPRAGGRIAALKQDVAEVRYPKKVRDLKKLEAEAVELCAYNNSVIHGLLQTEGYARAVFDAHRPALTEDEVEQQVTARLARQGILDLSTGRRVFSFVQCESTLRRPMGGRMVMRQQFERLLEVAQLRNVDLQVLPLDREVNSGTGGSFRLLKLQGGTTVAFSESPLNSRVTADPKETTVLDIRYGALRAQALSPQDSLPLIEKALGDLRT